MSDKERMSSFASTVGGGRPQGELQVCMDLSYPVLR
jgi:hypothetical protein